MKNQKATLEKSPASHEIASLFHGQLLSYMVGFYIFAFYLELHNRFPILQTIRFQFTYGAIVGAFCLYKFLNDTTKQPNFNSVTKTTFLLIFIMGIYTIFSMDRPESMIVYNDRVIKFALVSFFIYAATDKIADLRVILAFILLAWLKIGQEGFLGWSTGSLMWENQGIQRLHGSTAMYGHPNSFSGFAVGCLPYTLFLLMCVKSNLLRLGLLAIIICSLIIVVNTGSRTGYVAVVIGAAYFFFTLKTGKFKIILLASLTVMLTINIVPQQYKERFGSIFTGEEKEGGSSHKRMEIIEDAIAVSLRYPLGIGLQAFPKVRNDMFGRAQNTHNLYLEILTNIGPIGFIVFTIFIIKLLALNKSLIKCLELLSLPHNEKQFLMHLCKGTIGFILIRLLLGLFGMDLYEIYWWIALGFTLAITKLIHKNNFTPQ
jgi:putative inorganic carbon (hco3(-)) transporter